MKKIIVTSVTSWNEKSGSDTLPSLLDGYNPDLIATICFKTEQSTSKVSSRYFNICENRVIKSIFKPRTKTGFEIDRETQNTNDFYQEQTKEKKRYSFWSRHRLWIVVLMRELLWKLGKPKSQDLFKYINSHKPDVLFCPIESYLYFNSVNIWIAKTFNIPIVSIMWDDNYSFKQHPFNPFYCIHRLFLRKQVKTISRLSATLFAVTEKGKTELEHYLKRKVDILTKCVSFDETKLHSFDMTKETITMVYSGKLNLGRSSTLVKLIGAINAINKKTSAAFALDIFSNTPGTKKVQAMIASSPFTTFKGFIDQNNLKEKQKEYDILVSLEALHGFNKNISRLSMSTKIVDYMATGGCILNISPKNTATFEYFQQNQIGVCCNSKKSIFKQLNKISKDRNIMLITSKKCFEFAKRKHNSYTIQKLLYDSIQNC